MKKVILYDINKELCDLWQKVFSDVENVEIKNIDFEHLECQTVVTAGNSYGWMTGGLDLAVRNYYGIEIQDQIQKYIINHCNGELPVGEMFVIKTGDVKKPQLMYTPTMRMPKKIFEIDVFYLFSKILLATNNYDEIEEIAICGLGTLTGGITPEQCAEQMRLAYEYVLMSFEEKTEKPKLDLTLIKEICKAHIAEHNDDGDVMFRCNQALQILEMIEEGNI